MKHGALLSLVWVGVAYAAPVPTPASTDYFKLHQPYASLQCPQNTTSADMERCVTRLLTDADVRLNQAYQILLKRLKADETGGNWLVKPSEQLIRAQRDWISLKNSGCAFETHESASSPYYQNHLNLCLLTYTRERADYLQWFVDHP